MLEMLFDFELGTYYSLELGAYMCAQLPDTKFLPVLLKPYFSYPYNSLGSNAFVF